MKPASPNTVDFASVRDATPVKLPAPVLVDTAEFHRAAYLAALTGLCSQPGQAHNGLVVATAKRLADESVNAIYHPKEAGHGIHR